MDKKNSSNRDLVCQHIENCETFPITSRSVCISLSTSALVLSVHYWYELLQDKAISYSSVTPSPYSGHDLVSRTMNVHPYELESYRFVTPKRLCTELLNFKHNVMWNCLDTFIFAASDCFRALNSWTVIRNRKLDAAVSEYRPQIKYYRFDFTKWHLS